jgi:NAD(P)-dependent dehydrogenase (short-subunit alcohol dehydrogenase family)
VDLGLADARVLVVGGSRGMGRAAAETFAGEGARVAVLARASDALDDTVATLHSVGSPDGVLSTANLTDLSEVNSAIDRLGERWDALEVLVNTAGPVDVGIGPFDRLDDDEWRDTFDIGVFSAVRTVRRSLPLLRRGSFGRIVNVSAHSTKRQSPDLVAYTAAKAALSSFSKNLSLTLAPDGILVNTISPGSFLSAGMKGYLKALPSHRRIDPDDLRAAMRIIGEDFGHPAQLGRVGLPAEIGPVIAFAASRANTYMTGADINVDGGSDFLALPNPRPVVPIVVGGRRRRRSRQDRPLAEAGRPG